jgi:hypothetical protein
VVLKLFSFLSKGSLEIKTKEIHLHFFQKGIGQPPYEVLRASQAVLGM